MLELKQNWLVMLANNVGAYFPDPLTKAATSQGIDIESYMIQQTRKALFAPNALKAQMRIESGEISLAQSTKGLDTSMPTVFIAQKVETPAGSYGYIRIRTFAVDDDEKFIKEFINLAKQLPQNGLIIDVRNNGGGLILCK